MKKEYDIKKSDLESWRSRLHKAEKDLDLYAEVLGEVLVDFIVKYVKSQKKQTRSSTETLTL
jgi:hypothetical protein